MRSRLAVLLTRMGEDEAAAVLLGTTTSSRLHEAERRRLAVATRSLRERLGDEAVERSMDEGARMTGVDVIDIALDAVARLHDE